MIEKARRGCFIAHQNHSGERGRKEKEVRYVGSLLNAKQKDVARSPKADGLRTFLGDFVSSLMHLESVVHKQRAKAEVVENKCAKFGSPSCTICEPLVSSFLSDFEKKAPVPKIRLVPVPTHYKKALPWSRF
jgi:hypothetical protein